MTITFTFKDDRNIWRTSYEGKKHVLEQFSATFLAPGTSFLEDNFSMDWGQVDGFRMI